MDINSRVPSISITEVGSPISMFYGFQNDGIFQTQAEADAHGQLMEHTMHLENLELEMLMEMDKLTMTTVHKSVILTQTSFTGVNMNFNVQKL